MLTNKKFVALAVVTAVCVAAAIFSRQTGQDDPPPAQGLYFPDLLAQSNRVARAVIKTSDSVTTITKTGDLWRIDEIGAYPAATDKVRELILGLARLQRVEAKTKNPDLYDKLELGNVDTPGSSSSLLQLLDGSGKKLATLIVGKRKPGQAGSTARDRIYVRAPDERQTWLVEGFLPAVDATADSWVEQAIITPAVAAVRSVTVRGEGDPFTLFREDANAKDFMLEALGADGEIQSQYAVNEIVQSFIDLRLEEVRPAAEADPDAGEYAEIVLESFDGERIHLSLRRQDDRYLGRMRAEPVQAEVAAESAGRIEQWNGLWQGRVYVLPDYQVDAIVVGKEDLVKTQE